MQRALILGGGTGLLGQALAKTLEESQRWEVISLGRREKPIFDKQYLTQALEEICPDVTFNTIAWTQVDDAEDHPEEAARVNSDFPHMLAEAIARGKSHLVHFSTDFVFGAKGNETPYSEKDTPSPQSVYGKTKLAGEEAVQYLLPDRSAVLRTAWLFGPWKKNFVSTILAAAKTRKEVRVVSDQTGSPTYTLDLAAWSMQVAEKRATGLYHATNTGSASWYSLAKKSIELSAIDCAVVPITSDEWPQKAKRPAYSVLSSAKLTDLLQKPLRSWEEALTCYLDNSDSPRR